MTIHDQAEAARQSVYDDALRAAAQVAHRDGFDVGAASRQPEVDQLQAAVAAARDELEAAQNAYDAHMATHQPEPARQTLFGFWAGSDTPAGGGTTRGNYDRVRGYLGDPQVYRMFYSGLPPTRFADSNAAFGPPVVLSFKASPLDVVAGKLDAHFKACFASIPLDLMVWWSYYHEPEDDIEKGAFTAAQYRAAWAHLIALAPKRHTLRATLILMEFTLRNKARRVEEYVAPGLDVLAWDCYASTSNPTARALLAEPAAKSAELGLGFGVAELSASSNFQPGPGHAAALERFVSEVKSEAVRLGAEFVTWFETHKVERTEQTVDFRLRRATAAVAAWKK